VAFAFLGFTVLATLGTGEHYFVDLVVDIKLVFPEGLGVMAAHRRVVRRHFERTRVYRHVILKPGYLIVGIQ